MIDDDLKPEEIHILYCLHILELNAEETAAKVWLKAGPVSRPANEAYVRWVFNNIERLTASGELPPFQKEEFLEWSGLPAEPVKRLN